MTETATDWAAVFGSQAASAPRSPLGSLVYRPAVYSRNGVTWMSVRSWGSRSKRADLDALVAQKDMPLPAFVPGAAAEIAALIERTYGAVGPTVTVTTVPCGHSRRRDCAGKQLAAEVAVRIGAEFVALFADRFVKGSSHPKEFRKLPPLALIAWSERSIVLVVDDVATSGWHMEEALMALRSAGYLAFGVAWISGTIGGSPSSAAAVDWTAGL